MESQTRSLAAVTTGESVVREKPLPGAVLTRVASSHIRVGTFQFFAAKCDVEAVKLLADHVVARHYPEAAKADRPYRALLDEVISRQELVSRWLLVGFIHGVMNTDNMSIAGETIDYGPCAFMDSYDAGKVFSSIDHQGRYAYGNQPRIAHWNLVRLAEALLPILCDEQEQALVEANEALAGFGECFGAALQSGMNRKLGLSTECDDDPLLAEDLLNIMAAQNVDFTLTFRRLSDAAAGAGADEPVRRLFADPAPYEAWALRWRKRLDAEPQYAAGRHAAMRAVNPAYIARNHRVEAVIDAAVGGGNFAPFDELLTVLSHPFEDRPGFEHYADPPQPHEQVRQTFCGT